MSDPIQQRSASPDALSRVLVFLLKGAVSRGDDARVWGDLVQLQARVCDFVSVLGLGLVIDDSEGYAFVTRSHDLADRTREEMPVVASFAKCHASLR